MLSVTTEEVQWFRLFTQNLSKRLPASEYLKVSGACGLQNSPPGSAELSLLARLDNFNAQDFETAAYKEKTMLQTWSLRAAPYFYPVEEAALFTQAIKPQNEEDLRHFLSGVKEAIDKLGIEALEILSRTLSALDELMPGCELTRDELGRGLAAIVSKTLTSQQQTIWKSSSWYAKGQTLGESIMRFFVYAAALTGKLCYAPRKNNTASYMLTEEFLGYPTTGGSDMLAAKKLLEKYLHCFGPATVKGFSAWTGISLAHSSRIWTLMGSDITEVIYNNSSMWVLNHDLELLKSVNKPEGVRLLPPHDPYLQLTDRETLIRDKKIQKYFWRVNVNPGMVLLNGIPVAGWRTNKTGNKLKIIVDSIQPLDDGMIKEIGREAERIADYKKIKTQIVVNP